MQRLMLSCWFVLLLYQTVQAFHFGDLFGGEDQVTDRLDNLSKHSESPTSHDSLSPSNISFEPYDSTSEYRSEQVGSESSSMSGNGPRTEQAIPPATNVSQLQSTENFTTVLKTEAATSTSEIQKVETLAQSFSNESHSQSPEISSTKSSSVINGNAQSSNMSTMIFVTPSSITNQSSSSDADEEPEGVIIGKPFSANGTTETPHKKTLYEKTLDVINDAYTLSIIVPVAAGVVFATTIIVTIAICRCLKRRCRRRRIRRNAKLPDSVKNLRPSDNARLLAESSDEEF